MKKWLTAHLRFLGSSSSGLPRTVISDREFNETPDAVRVADMKAKLQGTNCRLVFTDAAVADILNSVDKDL